MTILRLALYNYHRLGLDQMHEPDNHKAAKETIKSALMDLKVVNDKRRNSLLMQIFLMPSAQKSSRFLVVARQYPLMTSKMCCWS
ncbi:MAG: DUF4835 family protein [Owenweeksia sp.]|nr:DUF4835 family protein [Owenweeksia sp.]